MTITQIDQCHCSQCEGAIPQGHVISKLVPLGDRGRGASHALEADLYAYCEHCDLLHAVRRASVAGQWVPLAEPRLAEGEEYGRVLAALTERSERREREQADARQGYRAPLRVEVKPDPRVSRAPIFAAAGTVAEALPRSPDRGSVEGQVVTQPQVAATFPPRSPDRGFVEGGATS